MGKGGGGDGGLAKREAKREAASKRQIQYINNIFDNPSRGLGYTTAADAVFELDKGNLDNQRGDTERLLRFGLARRGLYGGSQDVDQHLGMDNVYNKGLLQVKNRRDNLLGDWRAKDEALRANLINKASADATSVDLNNAQAQLNANIAQNKATATDNSIAQLFQAFSNAYGRSRYNSDIQTAYEAGRTGTPLPTNTSYYGRSY